MLHWFLFLNKFTQNQSLKTIGMAFIFIVVLVGCRVKSPDTLHQIEPVTSLMQGRYDGYTPYSDIMKWGDFGIGTFHQIDGEMVALDGVFYQIASDGRVYQVQPNQKTPYASVHFFNPAQTHKIEHIQNMKDLSQVLDQLIKNPNQLVGIKIHVQSESIQLRSPKAQLPPYASLQNVLATQSIFNYKNDQGTLVGYYSPSVLGQLIVPGYHFHYISDDRKRGGHVLDVQIQSATVFLDPIQHFTLHMSGFSQSDGRVSFKSDTHQVFQTNE